MCFKDMCLIYLYIFKLGTLSCMYTEDITSNQVRPKRWKQLKTLVWEKIQRFQENIDKKSSCRLFRLANHKADYKCGMLIFAENSSLKFQRVRRLLKPCYLEYKRQNFRPRGIFILAWDTPTRRFHFLANFFYIIFSLFWPRGLPISPWSSVREKNFATEKKVG